MKNLLITFFTAAAVTGPAAVVALKLNMIQGLRDPSVDDARGEDDATDQDLHPAVYLLRHGFCAWLFGARDVSASSSADSIPRCPPSFTALHSEHALLEVSKRYSEELVTAAATNCEQIDEGLARAADAAAAREHQIDLDFALVREIHRCCPSPRAISKLLDQGANPNFVPSRQPELQDRLCELRAIGLTDDDARRMWMQELEWRHRLGWGRTLLQKCACFNQERSATHYIVDITVLRIVCMFHCWFCTLMDPRCAQSLTFYPVRRVLIPSAASILLKFLVKLVDRLFQYQFQSSPQECGRRALVEPTWTYGRSVMRAVGCVVMSFLICDSIAHRFDASAIADKIFPWMMFMLAVPSMLDRRLRQKCDGTHQQAALLLIEAGAKWEHHDNLWSHGYNPRFALGQRNDPEADQLERFFLKPYAADGILKNVELEMNKNFIPQVYLEHAAKFSLINRDMRDKMKPLIQRLKKLDK